MAHCVFDTLHCRETIDVQCKVRGKNTITVKPVDLRLVLDKELSKNLNVLQFFAFKFVKFVEVTFNVLWC